MVSFLKKNTLLIISIIFISLFFVKNNIFVDTAQKYTAEIAQNTTESTVYLTCWMDKKQILKMIKKKFMFERLVN